MDIIQAFTDSDSKDFDKFINEHLSENSLQYAENLLEYSLLQKEKLPTYSPDYMVYWSVQLSCQHHLVMSGLYEQIHDSNQSKIIVRKKHTYCK